MFFFLVLLDYKMFQVTHLQMIALMSYSNETLAAKVLKWYVHILISLCEGHVQKAELKGNFNELKETKSK